MGAPILLGMIFQIAAGTFIGTSMTACLFLSLNAMWKSEKIESWWHFFGALLPLFFVGLAIIAYEGVPAQFQWLTER